MAGSTPRPPPGFQCPYERRCPHLDTMSAQWVLGEYRRRPAREDGLWMHVDALGEDVREANRRIKELEKENATLKAKLGWWGQGLTIDYYGPLCYSDAMTRPFLCQEAGLWYHVIHRENYRATCISTAEATTGSIWSCASTLRGCRCR